MTGALTAEIQATRPDLDEVYEGLGQRVRVYRSAPLAERPPPTEHYDDRGNLITPAATDPAPPVPGEILVGDHPCVFSQLDAKDVAALGADIAVPHWEGVVHWSAKLDEPGLTLVVYGGELPAPLRLVPLGDVVDEGLQRVAWTLTARAPAGNRS